jgi:exodeoxyribonuclease VII small subunit
MKNIDKGLNYETAINELQNIVAALQNEEIGVDDLTEKVKRAADLIRFCKEKLRKVQEDMDEVLRF